MFILRRSNPQIYLWWNAGKHSQHGIIQHNYICNGYYVQSNRAGRLCLDVMQRTKYTDILDHLKARG